MQRSFRFGACSFELSFDISTESSLKVDKQSKAYKTCQNTTAHIIRTIKIKSCVHIYQLSQIEGQQYPLTFHRMTLQIQDSPLNAFDVFCLKFYPSHLKYLYTLKPSVFNKKYMN